jgi:predicted nucleic acid-binding Zn ribbon protein
MSRRATEKPISRGSREIALRDIWIKNGMPEVLIIHANRETIRLFNGLPEDTQQKANLTHKTTLLLNADGKPVPRPQKRVCKVCGAVFYASNGHMKLCSDKCRKINASELVKQHKNKKAEAIMEKAKILDRN